MALNRVDRQHRAEPDPRQHERRRPGLCHQPERHHLRRRQPDQCRLADRLDRRHHRRASSSTTASTRRRAAAPMCRASPAPAARSSSRPGAQITTNAPASVTSGGGFVLLMGTRGRQCRLDHHAERPDRCWRRATTSSCGRASAPTPTRPRPRAATRSRPVIHAGQQPQAAAVRQQHRADLLAAGRHHAGRPAPSCRTASCSRPPRSTSAAPSIC